MIHLQNKADLRASFNLFDLAIAACVAAGTGVAIMPLSVLKAVNVEGLARALPLPARLGRVRTHLVWRSGQESRLLRSVWGEVGRVGF
ncbi:hypothetical protein DYL61_05375 [Pseudomonas nabeulensis]|uniref:LysR substrate-binding domain-containing protein n=1 Tax=Pseudomonas nabeulensis TaxID=2293833 RepID=A0A4Z0B7R1_9PSED|nr:LysR substrate-binding domain-containing protein [Pseudomonas nabeulensis]TFY95105.1 hypothetical protein DYL61_05375 [Pseudomonas nabeulensis]